jgi:hypothetical protein
MLVVLCQHCGGRRALAGKRGLCQPCYMDPAVRPRYESDNPRRGRRFDLDEPTEDQLRQTIADQLGSLPPWWDDETRMVERAEGEGSTIVAGHDGVVTAGRLRALSLLTVSACSPVVLEVDGAAAEVVGWRREGSPERLVLVCRTATNGRATA